MQPQPRNTAGRCLGGSRSARRTSTCCFIALATAAGACQSGRDEPLPPSAPVAAIEGPEPEASSQRRTLDVEGLSFVAIEAGPTEGAAVLLLHEFPDGTEQSYASTITTLANVGYRVIAAVRQGAVEEELGPQERARLALAFADDLGLDRFHAADGETAWELARLAPERVISILSARRGHAQAEPPPSPELPLSPEPALEPPALDCID